MRHHHTKFGYKRFRSSEDIVQKNAETLSLHCDLDLEYSNPSFSQDTGACDGVPSNLVAKQPAVQKKLQKS